MRNRRIAHWKHCLMLLAGCTLAFGAFAGHAAALSAAEICSSAASDSTTDTDGDGFTDYQECTGVKLYNGTAVGETIVTDPTVSDLFVILVSANDLNSANTSLLPENPLALISKPRSEGGIGVTVRQISHAAANPSRYVSPDCAQKAVKVTESIVADYPTNTVLGLSNYGTPNGLDGATVFTKRTYQFLESVYGAGKTPPEVLESYIRHTIAHEVGHVLSLSATYNSRFGGYHYKTGSNVVMEQSVVYTAKGSTVTFYISDDYATADTPKLK